MAPVVVEIPGVKQLSSIKIPQRLFTGTTGS
jgi:hypothetical protein